MTPRLPAHTRQAFLFSALCLLLLCPHAARARAPQESEPSLPKRSIERPRGIKKFGRNFLDFLTCKKLNDVKRRELLAYGPQFPDRYDPSDFSFWALVNTNWPMTVEYELESQGTALITIRVMGADLYTQKLTGEGIGKHQTVRFTLPVYSGKGPHAALITFKATRPGPHGDERASFLFVGAGAGKASNTVRSKESNGVEVASLGPLPFGGGRSARAPAGQSRSDASKIYDVTFRPKGGAYEYTFRVGDSYNRWSVDIMKDTLKGGYQEYETVKSGRIWEQHISPNRPITDDWNGRDRSEKIVRNVSVWVFVMAWLSAENSGEWDARARSLPYPIN